MTERSERQAPHAELAHAYELEQPERGSLVPIGFDSGCVNSLAALLRGHVVRCTVMHLDSFEERWTAAERDQLELGLIPAGRAVQLYVVPSTPTLVERFFWSREIEDAFELTFRQHAERARSSTLPCFVFVPAFWLEPGTAFGLVARNRTGRPLRFFGAAWGIEQVP
jgi:hypothetical protein